MTNHYTDVCEATIKSLRQQLADRDEQISDLTISSDTYFAERNSARDVWRRASKDRDELRQQLAERDKQIVMLRVALQQLHDNIAEYARLNHLGGFDNQDMRMAREAIAATDDLKEEVK